jgi:hypothetical protein
MSKDGEFVGSSQEEDEAKARNEALADARKQIIDSLGIEMSKESIREITSAGSSNEIGTQQSSAKIKMESIGRNILQVKPNQWHVEKWQKKLEKGVAYFYKVFVLVKFSKDEHDRFIDSMIMQIEDLSGQAITSAKQLVGEDKKVESIVEYFNVMNAARTINKITGIEPTKLINIKRMQRESLQPIREFFGKTKVTPITKTQLAAQAGDDLRDPIQLKFEYNGEPLSGMPVKFSFIEGAGDMTMTSITDSDGLVQTTVLKLVPAKNKDSIVIEAKPDVEIDEAGVPVIRFTIDTSKKILVRVIEKNIGALQSYSRLENALVSSLRKEGFKCVEPNTANMLIETGDISMLLNGEDSLIKAIAEKGVANWMLVGEVSTQESSKVMEGYIFARASAIVKVIRMDTSEVIVSENAEEKAASDTAEKAGTKALDNMAKKFAPKIINSMKDMLSAKP